MATIYFDIEIVNEHNGHTMDFEYEYEVMDSDLTEDEIRDIARDLETSVDPDLYDTILNSLSIIPRVSYIEMD